MKVACSLGRLLYKHNVSQQRLADESGVGQPHVSRLATGLAGGNIYTALRVVSALNRLTGQAYRIEDIWTLRERRAVIAPRKAA